MKKRKSSAHVSLSLKDNKERGRMNQTVRPGSPRVAGELGFFPSSRSGRIKF
jgi:hypothetical protein